MKRRIASFVAVAASSALSHAAIVDATWLGSNSTWHNAAGWNVNAVPNNGADTFNVAVPSGTVTLTTSPVTIDRFNVGPGGTFFGNRALTVLNDTTIDGTAVLDGGGLLRVGGSGLITGTGTVSIGPQPGYGTLATSASALTIDTNLRVFLKRGAVGENTTALVNRGLISGGGQTGSFAESRLSFTTIQNLGTIEPKGGVLVLNGGTYSRADLGNIAWSGGILEMRGTVNNVGQTFNIGAGELWFLNGTINGGTVNIAAGNQLAINYPGGGTLNNVVVNGKVSHGGGQPLNATTLSGNAEFQLTNRFLEGASSIVANNTTLTINSGVLIHGGGGMAFAPNEFGTGSGVEAQTVHNKGRIRSDSEFGLQPINGELSMLAVTVLNEGRLETLSKSWLYASGNVVFQNGGVLSVQMSPTDGLGMLRVAGPLNLNAVDALELSAGPGVQPGVFYRIATSSNRSGTFDTVTPGFEVQYVGNDVLARIIPEPASAVLLTLTIPALRRRRRR